MEPDLKLIVNDEKVMVSSQAVAERFGRQHKNILRRIERLDCSEEFTGLNFEPSEFKDASGKTNKEYLMTRDGFTFCVMGMIGKRAAQFKEQYITAFNQMEKELQKRHVATPLPGTPLEMMAMLAQASLVQFQKIEANLNAVQLAVDNTPISMAQREQALAAMGERFKVLGFSFTKSKSQDYCRFIMQSVKTYFFRGVANTQCRWFDVSKSQFPELMIIIRSWTPNAFESAELKRAAISVVAKFPASLLKRPPTP